MNKKIIKDYLVILVIILILMIGLFFWRFYELLKSEETEENNVSIKEINILEYSDNNIIFAIVPSTVQKSCTSVVGRSTDMEYADLIDGACVVDTENKEFKVYFKDKNGVASEVFIFNNFVIDILLDKKYYLALGDKISFEDKIIKFGNPNIDIVIEGDSITIEDGSFVSEKNGVSIIKFIYNSKIIKEVEIIVTDVIVKMPTSFNKKKSYLACKEYTEDEASLLDEILEFRINEAGYQTRAGVVAAGRFLTLEFPNRITYFYENGRVHSSGTSFVDGEGRYYKKVLYLSASKYDSIRRSLAGPAMWGCKLTNYEPKENLGFVKYEKYANGLDCSGFVTWALFNGGFDPGDIGAGETAYKHQLTDTGEYVKLTKELIYSGDIKVGDLVNLPGHIGLIIGIDDNNIYVAESLPTLKGLVMVTYSKKTIMNTFTHVVLMDDYYKEDGNITDMWY